MLVNIAVMMTGNSLVSLSEARAKCAGAIRSNTVFSPKTCINLDNFPTNTRYSLCQGEYWRYEHI